MSSAGDARRMLRLAKVKPHFVTSEGQPTSALFEPSSEDEQHAPVLTSVWDHDVMSVARARAILPGDENRRGWTVTETIVREVSEMSVALGRGAVEVVHDPAGTPSGADLSDHEKNAHHGISGLSGAGLSRAQEQRRRNVLRELARRATPVDPDSR